MAISLAWKSDDLPNNPHIVVKVESGPLAGTYGVWAHTGGGSARPVGSGRGINTLEGAIEGAQRANVAYRTGSRDD